MRKNWELFKICNEGERAPSPRSMKSKEGVGDRIRSAAFAEIQARDAFVWASENFDDASAPLKKTWRQLASEEHKHLSWLLIRLKELEISIDERPVSPQLWNSFMTCKTAEEFAIYMASAEERGRIAGERFAQQLVQFDLKSSRIFAQIAKEEVAHIRLAQEHFHWRPGMATAGKSNLNLKIKRVEQP